MKKRVPIPVLLLAIAISVLVTFQCTFIAVSESYKDELKEAALAERAYHKLEEIRQIVNQHYLFAEGVDESLLEDFLAEMYLYYYVGDQFSVYYNPDAAAEMLYESTGNFVGVGVLIGYSEEDGLIEILLPMEDSPAKAAGLQPGDKIVAVDGTQVVDIGYEEAINRVKGEAGTEVSLTVSRLNVDGTTTEFTVTLTRAAVKNQSVLYSRAEADPSIAIIRILQFDDGTPNQFAAALAQMKKDNIEKVIFDVRGNHGGEVTSVVSVLDQVVGRGIITTYRDINGNVLDVKRATSAEKLDIPMVVLTGRNTVSAAELFACTLKDYELATLIGTQTYGKGVGQRPYMLTDGSYIYITALYYDPPKSPNYHGVGIAPDLKVELPEQYQNMNVMRIPQSEDTQLVAAIAALNSEQ